MEDEGMRDLEANQVWKDYFHQILWPVLSILAWLVSSFAKPHEMYVPPGFQSASYPALESTVDMVILDIVVFAAIIPVSVFLSRRWKNSRIISAAWAISWNTFTICTVGTITNLLKFYVGRPRPNVYSVCGPNATLSMCQNIPEYQRYDLFASWPSGHSSIATTAAVFLTNFVRSAVRKFSMTSLMFSLTVLLLAFWVAATRIRDYKHHPSDVVSGIAIGFITASVIWKHCKPYIFQNAAIRRLSVHTM